MAVLDDLLPDLAVHISQVPAFIARPMLRQAVQTFCQESFFWQLEQDIVLTGAPRYELTIPEGLLVAGIVAAALDGRELRQGFDYELSGDEKAVVPLKTLAVGSTLRLAVAVKPARKSELVDDNLLEHYAMPIAEGAAAKLGANEGRAWALSKGQIVAYERNFKAAYQDARKRALNHASRLYEAPTRHKFFGG
mgnify:CR=1 FL=1